MTAPDALPSMGRRGERPCFLHGDAYGAAAAEVLKIPGVRRAGGGFECTWDAAWAVAALLGVTPPEVPLQDAASRLEAVRRMPGLARYRELGLPDRMRGYQKEDVLQLALWHWGLLANPMRSGKTPTVLAAAELVGAKKILCVVPALPKLGWASEIADFCQEEAVILYGRAGKVARVFCRTCNGRGFDAATGVQCEDCRLLNGQSNGLRLIDAGHGTCTKHSTTCPACAQELHETIDRARYVVCNYELLIAQQAKDAAGVKFVRDDLQGWVPHLTRYHFDLVIADECFIAGTAVSTPTGPHAIEDLRVGDVVHAYDEQTQAIVSRTVDGVRRSRPSALVRVVFADGTVVVCTPNHPFFTKYGWQPAAALSSQTVLCYYSADELQGRLAHGPERGPAHAGVCGSVRMVRHTARDHGAEGLGDFVAAPNARLHAAGVLLPDVQDELEAAPFTRDVAAPRKSTQPAHEDQQSNAVGGCTAEAASDAARDWTSAADTGWQRSRAAAPTTTDGHGAAVADGSCGADTTPAKAGLSTSIQDRHWTHGTADRSRDRRGFAPGEGARRAGCEEGQLFAWIGVDRVEALESGSDRRFGGLCPDGFVYNLAVAETPTYIAEGRVVHNCHMLRGWDSDETKRGLTRREKFNQLTANSERLWLVGGTPQFSFVADWWGQVDAASKGAATSWSDQRLPFDFHTRYCGGAKGEWGWEYKGVTPYAETEWRRRYQLFTIMRPRSEILPDMPKKQRQVIRLEADTSVTLVRRTLSGKLSVEGKTKKLMAITARVKLPYVIENVLPELYEGRKVMVVCFNPDTARLYGDAFIEQGKKREHKNRLADARMQVWVAHGDGLSTDARFRMGQAFREHQGAGVFVMTIDSFQVGVSLRGATTEHWVDMHHDPAAMLQAEDRPFEPDPKTGEFDERGLSIIYYVVKGTIDEHREATVLPKVDALARVTAEEGAVALRQTMTKVEEAETLAAMLQRIAGHIGEEWDGGDDA